MHFDFPPKVVHNENAIREYEREENKRVGRWIKWLVLILLPVIFIAGWLLIHR
jgi:hypothetical protein